MNEQEIYGTPVNIVILGYVIRKLRENRSLTLRELADKIRDANPQNSIDPSFISLIERGGRAMSYNVMAALGSALDVDPKWLVTLAFPLHDKLKDVKIKRHETEQERKMDEMTIHIQEIIAQHLFKVNFETFVEEIVANTEVNRGGLDA